ncbi:peptide-N4-(N-acetyl-beta-glucosaminyl)asparagine amidase A [Aristolochia californica]|uniref:peptide-N4-(N-acetyl-beta- glucosaminyl)asparagine amidase A n=1 Tax=Aristolochia californica TaxID=171875 RepID=UPI0035DF3EA0
MMRYHHLALLLLFLCSLADSLPPPPTLRFLKPTKTISVQQNGTVEEYYYQVTRPLPTDQTTPSCSLALLERDFADTYGSPPVSVDYSPPVDCPGEWTAVILEFNASCRGEQYDRIAAVWIDGVELLRTSTAEPTEGGIFWSVRKDVTRYASVLRRSDATLSVMLENIVNDVFTGVYHVNISAYYYGGDNESEWLEGFDQKKRVFEVGVEPLGREYASDDRGEELVRLRGKSRSKFTWLKPACWLRKLGFTSRKKQGKDRKAGFFLDDEDAVDRTESGELLKKSAAKARKLGLLSDQSGLEFPTVQASLFENGRRKVRSGSQGPGMIAVGRDFLLNKPANKIIPISSNGDDGFWFRIQKPSVVHSKSVEIPLNTYRAILEVYVSFHSNDEFWYSNPPNAYIQKNNLTTGRGNGSFRQVFATIDGIFAGSVVPFPVVFTGGINPLFWEPVVGIGAFNLPSYDLDLTPFLGILLDGNPHKIGLGVTDGIQYWLVDANLHLWVDHALPRIDAKLIRYRVPNMSVSRDCKFSGLDGSFKITARRKIQFAGWVNSSLGNITTRVLQELEFRNTIKFKKNGTYKEVRQKIKTKTNVRLEAFSVLLLGRTRHRTRYPLYILTTTLPKENNTSLLTTNFINGFEDELSIILPNQVHFSSLSDSQKADGWMLVQDHSVLSGSATTQQSYRYADETGCYSQSLVTSDGKVLDKNVTEVC